MKTLKVVSIDVRHSDKAGCDYKVVTFRALEDGAIVGTGVRNFWPKHEVTLADGSKSTINGDADYPLIQQGDVYAGEIMKFDTTPYVLNGYTINTWKGVVFKLENGLAVAARALRQNNNAAPVDPETGEVFTIQTAQKAQVNKKPALTEAEPA